MTYVKECPYCGVEFSTKYSFKIYCTKRCKDKFRNGTEVERISSRKYRKTEKGKLTARNYRQTKEYKELRKKHDIEWLKNNPEKVRAHVIARKILRQQCEVKDCMKLGVRHHEDYTKPEDITFLCDQHHKDIGRLGSTFMANTPDEGVLV